jgi:hypothetical protein
MYKVMPYEPSSKDLREENNGAWFLPYCPRKEI